LSTRARREREKKRRRNSILSAAREVFFEEGFHRATVDRVAVRAEVSKGTVYLYFDSKETLLAVLLLEGLDSLLKTLETAYAPNVPLAADERLRRLAQSYYQFFRDEPQYFHFLIATDRGRFRDSVAPEMYEQVLQVSLEGMDWVVKAVEQGVGSGVFACCDVRQAAATLWATLNGVLELMAHPLRRELIGVEPDVLYRIALETVIQGLRQESEES
jgi:AcrR family transcriptional regulator